MHEKNIKLIIRKQLKKDYPYWRRLTKRQKKEITKEVAKTVIQDYDFDQEVENPLAELLGIKNQVIKAQDHSMVEMFETDNQAVRNDIMSLEQMKEFVDDFYRNSMIDPKKIKRLRVNIKDSQLKYIDNMLDDHIINRLLSYKGYTPNMRKYYPSQFFRAELLKALKYPEISYRKYCTEEYQGIQRKQNREFIGLPLHKKQTIDHTQLCQFRTSLSFPQIVNLLVYILHWVYRSGILTNCVIHGVDSTDLANDNTHPLFSTTIHGKKIRIYKDIDCDCGKRRNKRNKSSYVIGYRMHTLTAIDAQTGHSFPLVSLIASANHHDSLFLKPLVQLAQSMGIEMALITADEAYHDNDESLFNETGVRLITPPSSRTTLPQHVNPETLKVMMDDCCEIPMSYIGCFEEGHEYKCNAFVGECKYAESCIQSRIIPIDNGVFQRTIIDNPSAQKAIDIRKNCERPFNLLKHREGLEEVRVRSQQALVTKCVIASMATLLIEIEKRCNNSKDDNYQIDIIDLVS